MSEDYIPTLDGWRAVAISLVLLSHSSRGNSMTEHFGFLGVALFFGISGYLICTKLLVERERTQQISLKKFYWRRAFRILPASLTYLCIIGFLGVFALAEVKGRDVASGIFLFANYLPDKSWDVNHFWSLSMEEHFYLLWPVMLASLGNKLARNIAFAFVAAVFLWRIWALHHFVLPGIPTLQRTDLRLDAFFAPCIYAIILRAPSWRDRATRWLRPSVCVSLLLGLALLNILRGTSAFFGSFRQLVHAWILPLLILSTVFRPATLVAKILELRLIRWVGRVSYSIYLWQMPFFSRHGWLALHTNSIPLKIAAILAAASLSYYLVELPLIRFGRTRERKVPQPVTLPRLEGEVTSTRI
jgi:peptidoglycan/LPS O-acetylase OafA/YrhL